MSILSRKQGITLVEVLTVIGVLGIFLCILLMALPRWREAARRANCTNNMQQIGLALLSYENQQKHLPGSAEVIKSDALRPVGGWSFLFKILPNMEYDTIYNSINPTEIKNSTLLPGDPGTLIIPLTSNGSASSVGGSGANAIAYARDTSINEFLCPCNPNQFFANPCTSTSTVGKKHALTNYKAMSSVFYSGFATNTGPNRQYTGTVTVPAGSYPGLYQCDGGLYPTNDGIRLKDISDGVSNTILCGETMDFTASSWIAGSDVNMVAIPDAAPQITTGVKPILFNEDSGSSYFALPGFNGQYYGRGGTRGIATFFALQYGLIGSPSGKGPVYNRSSTKNKDAGTYPLDPTAIPCQAGNRIRVAWFNKMLRYGPSSGHPSVINCLFGDGSVRGVRKDVDASALFFAVTRNNHDPAANDQL